MFQSRPEVSFGPQNKFESVMMNPADTAISELSEPVGEMTHEDYYKAATKSLPGAGLGSYSLPDDVRFVIHKGDGSRLQDVRGRWYIDYVGGAER